MAVPQIRVSARNTAPFRAERRYVLYWMIASRRTRWNFGLQRAVEAAVHAGKPLVVLEALRCDYRWSSDRLHRFVIEGMSCNAKRFAGAGVDYLPYVEPSPGAGRGLLEALARQACLVVTDDFPCSFLPRMVAAAAIRLDVRLEAVDSNGLLPVIDAESVFSSAYAFRRHLQRRLPAHLRELPEADPLAAEGLPRERALPDDVVARWPAASRELLGGDDASLAALPIDHGVTPVASLHGGEEAASATLESFVDEKLGRYLDDRNEPERDGTSGLSPYLHFGHISIHEVLLAVASREGWSPRDLASTTAGKREGWWGMSPAAESFLDEAVTWRELGYNFCARLDGHDRFEALPDWARRSLAEHASDARAYVYSIDELAQARTHDPLWNAAQTQLAREGRIHGYLRMLWGKKILEWTRSPEDALDAMIELNNRFALDGRNPNSYSGIFWVLGRFDRPWAPERLVFGVIRYMSSTNTAKKMKVGEYIRRYTGGPPLF
jgi:deoxyribodipyrimidine photo-lyase